MSEVCFACGGRFPALHESPTHAYMASSPGCWDAYTTILAREYEHVALFERCHRLTVDAFAVQHPGDPDQRRARQSFWVHGASLWLVLRMGRSHVEATSVLKVLAQGDFPVPPPPSRFALTHADVLAAPENEHVPMVEAWAEAALAGYHASYEIFASLALRAV